MFAQISVYMYLISFILYEPISTLKSKCTFKTLHFKDWMWGSKILQPLHMFWRRDTNIGHPGHSGNALYDRHLWCHRKKNATWIWTFLGKVTSDEKVIQKQIVYVHAHRWHSPSNVRDANSSKKANCTHFHYIIKALLKIHKICLHWQCLFA